jgi:hypothetical protein
VSPRTSLDGREILAPTHLPPVFNPRTVQSVANRYTDSKSRHQISTPATDKTSMCFCSYNVHAFIRYINIVSLRIGAVSFIVFSSVFLILSVLKPPPSIRPCNLVQYINQQTDSIKYNIVYHNNVTNLIHFHFHTLLCLDPLHVSGVKRPSSGDTTLAVFGLSCVQL